MFDLGSVCIFEADVPGRRLESEITSDVIDGVLRCAGRRLPEHCCDHVAPGLQRPGDISASASCGPSTCEIANPLTAASNRGIEEGQRAHVAGERAQGCVADEAEHVSDMSTAAGTAPAVLSARQSAPVPAPTSSTVAPATDRSARSRPTRACRTSRPGQRPMRQRRLGTRAWVRRSGIPFGEALAPPSEFGPGRSVLAQPSCRNAPASAARVARPTTRRLRCLRPRGSPVRAMVSSFGSGSRSQLTARYQASRRAAPPRRPGPSRAGSSGITSWPRLPSFQSPWMNVCGPACRARPVATGRGEVPSRRASAGYRSCSRRQPSPTAGGTGSR